MITQKNDNHIFQYMAWKPKKDSTNIILAVHGYNDYSNAFYIPGNHLLNSGTETISFDLRGFGRNQDRGTWFNLQYHLDDIFFNLKKIKDKHPEKNIFLLGESMGGAIILSLANKYHDLPIDGLILVAPAIWNFSESNFWKSLTLRVFSTIFPNLKVSGKGIIKVKASNNIEMLKELSQDRFFIHKPTFESLQGITELMDESFIDTQNYLKKPSYRTLILVPIIDEIVPRKPIISLLEDEDVKKNLSRIIDIGIYEKNFHMMLRDLNNSRVINHISIWIENKNIIKDHSEFKNPLNKLKNSPYHHRLEK